MHPVADRAGSRAWEGRALRSQDARARTARRPPGAERAAALATAGVLAPAVLAAPVPGLAAAAATPPPEAHAYWGSFLAEDGTWAFAPVGPSARTVQDGAVEGWRFATVAEGARPRPPRGLPAFADLCGEVPAVDGQARVGVVLDYGRAVDAPPGGGEQQPPPARGACAQVPDGSSGEAVLDDVATLRADAGVLCALDGYPAQACQPGVPLPDAARAADQPVDVAVGAPAPAADGAAPGGGGSGGPGGGLAGAPGLLGALAVALALSSALAAGGLALLRRLGAAGRRSG